MNEEEFIRWVNASEEHTHMIERMIEDRHLLKTIIENHLKQFFTGYESIQYERDFSKIVLEYPRETGFFIVDKLEGLMMPVYIEPSTDSGGFEILKIIVYPFGVPNEEGEL